MNRRVLILLLVFLALAVTSCTAEKPAGTTGATTAEATAKVEETTVEVVKTTVEVIDTTEEATTEAQNEPLELTLEELKAYDGKEGRPAYVAVDGLIYDMTESLKWEGGRHFSHLAGQGLTKEITDDSPHGLSMLERVPVVGKVVD